MTMLPLEWDTPPAFLRLQRLTDEEEALRVRLLGRLSWAKKVNARQESFYEGSRMVRDLGIAIPPHLRDLEAVSAFPEVAVDVMDERSDWRGWYGEGRQDFGLPQVYDDNHLQLEIAQSVLDALVCGLGLVTVGTGADDEPEVLVKAQSPNHATITWDARTNRVSDALIEVFDERGQVVGWRLYLPNTTVQVNRRGDGGVGRLVVVDRDDHNRGRVPISALLNRARSGRQMAGRSEITRAVRSITESAMRTLLGMEIAREFYAAPQRFLMGADESMFVNERGERVSQWAAIIGRLLLAPRDEDGELPVAGQFASASPQPFTELLKTYAQQMQGATGIPVNNFGFESDNPASEGAIVQANRRLDNKARRRHRGYDVGLINLAENIVLWRDGALPPPGQIKSHWADPSPPAPGAQADRAVKMVSVGALDPTWDFTLEQFGLSDDEIRRVRQEQLRSAGRSAVTELGARAAAARAAAQVPAIEELPDAPQS